MFQPREKKPRGARAIPSPRPRPRPRGVIMSTPGVCAACRESKVKCDRVDDNACSRCKRLGIRCEAAAPSQRGKRSAVPRLSAANRARIEYHSNGYDAAPSAASISSPFHGMPDNSAQVLESLLVMPVSSNHLWTRPILPTRACAARSSRGLVDQVWRRTRVSSCVIGLQLHGRGIRTHL